MALNSSSPPHFVLIPFMCQGHLIPMIDIAKILAGRGVPVTVITTPNNVARFISSIEGGSHLAIRVEQFQFPAADVGLPEGCEAVDNLPSMELMGSFFTALSFMKQPVEKILEELKPRPSCIIYDRNFTWIGETAAKYQIPRIWFDGKNCFSLLCNHNLTKSKVHERVSQVAVTFPVPGLSDRIEFRAAQLPGNLNPGVSSAMKEQSEKAKHCRRRSGWIDYKQNNVEKAQRGNDGSFGDENQCLKWLDSWPPNSVIYACFGSLSRQTPTQLIELGLALEASKRPFIWVIRGARGGYKKEEIEKWLKEEGFEDRIKGRGLLIRGWAPQVLILSHPSTAGFLTHCGWNSTLEGICAGVPMITWPLFSEQFMNGKLVVQILKIGVGVGVETAVQMGEEESGGHCEEGRYCECSGEING
ncbi:putative UDP-Glycosyltransferase superfamily protein [Hibiscus syriacus]|uniref:Glycosyltransferase n=1 Tax=Hibiscus syriacus TaxID=106335 RepID=A0A6A2XS39_HIBSY|nr:putative UDP-Glycosyltransferase superfamily protein [Hibiscus syriacus]